MMDVQGCSLPSAVPVCVCGVWLLYYIDIYTYYFVNVLLITNTVTQITHSMTTKQNDHFVSVRNIYIKLNYQTFPLSSFDVSIQQFLIK